MRNNCLIDWLRFSIPSTNVKYVSENVLNIPFSEFVGSDLKGSQFPTYTDCLSLASIKLHFSDIHDNVLVDFSGQACRQYEENLNRTQGFHWYSLISLVLENNGTITRIDLALDIFDDSSPTVKTLQDYVKRGQLSSKSWRFMEINSGRVSDGKITGNTLYIGSSPQILRIYDKKAERKDNVGEIVNVEKWVRWELEISDKKAMLVASKIANGKPLNAIIRGILSSHYSFKTRFKNKSDIRHKDKVSNMRWWDKFIDGIEKIPLKVQRDKITLTKKKAWLENNVSKSISMIYQTFKELYGKEYADIYLQQLIQDGKEKFTDLDKTLIDQRVVELKNEDVY